MPTCSAAHGAICAEPPVPGAVDQHLDVGSLVGACRYSRQRVMDVADMDWAERHERSGATGADSRWSPPGAPLMCRDVVFGCHTESAAIGCRVPSSAGSASREDARPSCSSPAPPEWPVAPTGGSAVLLLPAPPFRVVPPDSDSGRPLPAAPAGSSRRSPGSGQVCDLLVLMRAAPRRPPSHSSTGRLGGRGLVRSRRGASWRSGDSEPQ
jgi:hypothetical protein